MGVQKHPKRFRFDGVFGECIDDRILGSGVPLSELGDGGKMSWTWASFLCRTTEGGLYERDFRILEFSNFWTPLTPVLKSESILIW